MTPSNKQSDVLSVFIDRLASALAERLNQGASTRASVVSAPARKASGSRRKGQKRSPALLLRMTSELLAHIKETSGQRIEKIASELGYSTQDLKLPAQKLLAEKKVKTKGARRGTKYFPA